MKLFLIQRDNVYPGIRSKIRNRYYQNEVCVNLKELFPSRVKLRVRFLTG